MSDTIASKAVSVVGLSGTPGQGPFMAIVLQVAQAQVITARYSTYGCTVAEQCGQWVCDEIEGKALVYAETLDETKLLHCLGQMPLAREHCPVLAIGALKKAIAEAQGAGHGHS